MTMLQTYLAILEKISLIIGLDEYQVTRIECES
jgi:hypothetical protein